MKFVTYSLSSGGGSAGPLALRCRQSAALAALLALPLLAAQAGVAVPLSPPLSPPAAASAAPVATAGARVLPPLSGSSPAGLLLGTALLTAGLVLRRGLAAPL